jgi:hypothetical protein
MEDSYTEFMASVDKLLTEVKQMIDRMENDVVDIKETLTKINETSETSSNI